MTRKVQNRTKTDKRRSPKQRKPNAGQFKKGTTGNPKGRPKKDFDLVTRCRELTPDIIERYGMLGARAKTAGEVLAGRIVLEYGNDKPRQRTEITGPGGLPLAAPIVLVVPDDGSGDPGAD